MFKLHIIFLKVHYRIATMIFAHMAMRLTHSKKHIWRDKLPLWRCQMAGESVHLNLLMQRKAVAIRTEQYSEQ